MKSSLILMLATVLASMLVFRIEGYKLDIIGFYGNSGNAPSYIPLLGDIPCYYNVIILTFLNFQGNQAVLQMIGPYGQNTAALKQDIIAWKKNPDPYGRSKRVLVSVGGQNGNWPVGISSATVESELETFFQEYSIDGLDVDLEGSSIASASTLVPALTLLKNKGYVISASPEAAQTPLNNYHTLLASVVNYYHPQFYNNPPNAVTIPYIPAAAGGPWQAPPRDWQDPTPSYYVSNGESWWVSVLDAINDNAGLDDSKRGMLVPTSTIAAGSYNNWDFAKLANSIKTANITHVGTWAIAYDNLIGYTFAKTMAATMGSYQC